MVICLFCQTHQVPLSQWNKRCPVCREEQAKKDHAERERLLQLGKRDPAAIIETENGAQVFVDKFGQEVENPGYDLKNDPRGWSKTGTRPKKVEMIR